ncbi:MAG: polysaccharide deacetylase family protein [Bacteroidales bacterium]|nr:polysaccharide deacetylase family protein [Candidatus Colimorpha onthohippi]
MLLVYTPRLTNRIGYTLNVLLGTILRIPYQITTDTQLLRQSAEYKLVYGNERVDDYPFIQSSHFLLETRISKQELGHFMFHGIHALFPTSATSDIPFDPLASAFFMLSRYEEYLPFQPDQHGRFPATLSAAYEYGFLQSCVVDHWAIAILDLLKQYYPDFQTVARKYNIQTTIDIDAAYCYKHKGMLLTCAGLLKDVFINHQSQLAIRRLKVLIHQEPDPFDTFQYILDTCKSQPRNHIIFFALVSDYDTYDKPIHYTNTSFRKLLRNLYDYAKIGIHPSYPALENANRINIETERLSEITHRNIIRNRFHYLRFRLPQSYQHLIDFNIQHDYSMGYADQPGFRSGTCTPYPYFDLTINQEQPLTIHPFAAMDATFVHNLHYTADQSYDVYQKLIHETQSVNGTLCCLWHNQNLCEEGLWKGWRNIFETVSQSSN